MQPNDAVYPSLRNRAVLITGGASGIGAAHVAHFAAQGARVAFVDIARDAGEALADAIAAKGQARPLFMPCDLRDISALQLCVAEAGRVLGDIGVLVNNAAHDERHAWKDVTVDYWEDRQRIRISNA